MALLNTQLETILQPSISAMGYELVGIEFLGSGKHSVLRLYIDSPKGINVDDCSRVSAQVSAILDVEDPIAVAYTLEISSPGINRALFKLDDYQRFLGHQVKLRLKHLVAGKRNLVGEISQVSHLNQQIKLLTAIDAYQIEFSNIDKANLVVNF